jgi:trk system potassium uptake protein TrkH
MNIPTRATPSRQRIPIPARLVGGLAVLTAAGTLLLMLPGVGSTRPLYLNEAVFTAVSALSVTGLSIIAPGRDFTLFGQFILLLLIQIGGVGFMVLAVVVLQLLGRQVLLEDRLALRDSLGLIRTSEITRLTRRVLVTVVIIELFGAVLLFAHWSTFLPLEPGRIAFYAVFHSVSAFCNAGFDLFGGLPQFPRGVPNDAFTLTVLGALILIGGLGIPVVGDLLSWPKARALSLHTRITLFIATLLTVSGTVSIFLSETFHPGALNLETVEDRLGLSLFQAISARTAGYAGFPGFETLSPGSQLALMALMFIGSAPASMGGGITTGTFAVMLLAVLSFTRGLPATRVGGRTIGAASIRKAGAVLTVSLIVVITATYLIVVSHPQSTLDKALFEVVSAFATCGLTLGFTPQLNLFGQLVIILVMFWGRLGALTIVAALAMPRRKSAVTYPEEQILIG